MLLCAWDFLGKNIGVGCHAFLQGIFPTAGIELASPALAGELFTSSATWEARTHTHTHTHTSTILHLLPYPQEYSMLSNFQITFKRNFLDIILICFFKELF